MTLLVWFVQFQMREINLFFIYFYLLVPWKEGNDLVFGGSRTRGRLQGGRRWEKYNEITVYQSMGSTKQQGEMSPIIIA